MFDSIFFSLSLPSIKELLSAKEFKALYDGVYKYNYLYEPDHPLYGECAIREMQNEDLTILVLLALRYIKSVKINNGFKKITEQHVSNAIVEMRDIWDRLCFSSYHFIQMTELEEFDDIDPRTFYVDHAKMIFRNILFAIGEFKNTTTNRLFFNNFNKMDETINLLIFDKNNKGNIGQPTPFMNDEIQSLKECINNLLSVHSPLDYLPIDIIKLLDKELYTLKYKDFEHRKGIVSWHNIINQIKNTDNLLVVKDFLDRAIKSTINDKDNRNTIIEYLDSKVEEVINPKPISHTTNNFFAPVSQVANNIEHQEIKK